MSAQVRAAMRKLPPEQVRSLQRTYLRRASWLLGVGGPIVWVNIMVGKQSSSAAVDRGCWALGIAGLVSAVFGAVMLANPDLFIRVTIRRQMLRTDRALAAEYASTLRPAIRRRKVLSDWGSVVSVGEGKQSPPSGDVDHGAYEVDVVTDLIQADEPQVTAAAAEPGHAPTVPFARQGWRSVGSGAESRGSGTGR